MHGQDRQTAPQTRERTDSKSEEYSLPRCKVTAKVVTITWFRISPLDEFSSDEIFFTPHLTPAVEIAKDP
jgi:hypothetical protein